METIVDHRGIGRCAHYTIYITPPGVELIRSRLLAAGQLTLPIGTGRRVA